MLIESQLADFQAQKSVTRDCRRGGKCDFDRVLLLPRSADAREGGRIAEIEGDERLFRDQGHVHKKPYGQDITLHVLPRYIIDMLPLRLNDRVRSSGELKRFRNCHLNSLDTPPKTFSE
jgi:hypothetical protein